MNIHWALYDPSHLSQEDSYWTWHAPALTPPLLEQFYYGVASKNLPPAPNELTDAVFWGGLAAPIGKWAVAYRFLDGGRDRQGRPGRFVLLTAWMYANTIDGDGHVFKNVFSHQTFRDVESIATTSIPVPTPVELSAHFVESSQRKNSVEQYFADSKIFSGACRQFSESLAQGGMHMLLHKNGGDFHLMRIGFNPENGKYNSAGNPKITAMDTPQSKKYRFLSGALILAIAIAILGVGTYSGFAKIIYNRIKAIMQIQMDGSKPEKQAEKILPHSRQTDGESVDAKMSQNKDFMRQSDTNDAKTQSPAEGSKPDKKDEGILPRPQQQDAANVDAKVNRKEDAVSRSDNEGSNEK